MRLMRVFWTWLISPAGEDLSTEWLTAQERYDSTRGWEGPTFRGRFRR
jgi:hypothetical protein